MEYQHDPLPEGDVIRLLHVNIAEDTQQPICTFQTVSLEPETPKYTAISYTWGDGTPVRRVACADGRWIGLSTTLSDLFDVLQKRSKSFTLWIDALCINQNNPLEKGHQVNQMGNVYSKAEQVLVWLGLADEASRMLFNLGNYLETDGKYDEWRR
jgi:hypothetical protein